MKEHVSLRRTPLYDQHVALGARMTGFAGWDMPLMYPSGVIAEHLATRRNAGLFDVSHMGRFLVRGNGALGLLQRLLTNNVAALEVGQAQHTFISDHLGVALDDAYVYRFVADEYLLVVNAANRETDWDYLHSQARDASGVELLDQTEKLAMLSLQGPRSQDIIAGVLSEGRLPEPQRNKLSRGIIAGIDVLLSRTGYTGEPLGFELIIPSEEVPLLWDLFIHEKAQPVGLGARDTLRLEAGFPLYGHELGSDPTGRPTEIFASSLALRSVNFSPAKGDYTGRAALLEQHTAYERIVAGDYSLIATLPRIIRPVALTSRGIARAGAEVFWEHGPAGLITSGTMIPYWKTEGRDPNSHFTDEFELRPICLALLDGHLQQDDKVHIDVRGKNVEGVVVPHHLRSNTPPYARPIVYGGESVPARRQTSG